MPSLEDEPAGRMLESKPAKCHTDPIVSVLANAITHIEPTNLLEHFAPNHDRRWHDGTIVNEEFTH
jgi:hypothetical protein